jgi:hypothetical protein
MTSLGFIEKRAGLFSLIWPFFPRAYPRPTGFWISQIIYHFEEGLK